MDEILKCNHSNGKATEQFIFFPVVNFFGVLHKEVPMHRKKKNFYNYSQRFEFMDSKVLCYELNDNFLVVLCCASVYILYKMVIIFGNDKNYLGPIA